MRFPRLRRRRRTPSTSLPRGVLLIVPTLLVSDGARGATVRSVRRCKSDYPPYCRRSGRVGGPLLVRRLKRGFQRPLLGSVESTRAPASIAVGCTPRWCKSSASPADAAFVVVAVRKGCLTIVSACECLGVSNDFAVALKSFPRRKGISLVIQYLGGWLRRRLPSCHPRVRLMSGRRPVEGAGIS